MSLLDFTLKILMKTSHKETIKNSLLSLYYLSEMEHSEIIKIIVNSSALAKILSLNVIGEKSWQYPCVQLLGNIASSSSNCVEVFEF